MITMILWIFFFIGTGMDRPSGAVSETEIQCQKDRTSIVEYAKANKLEIYAISDCTPVQLKSKD